ncbi:hypothetical protein FRC12_023347, partial [Ceratobasidium sp. 428]
MSEPWTTNRGFGDAQLQIAFSQSGNRQFRPHSTSRLDPQPRRRLDVPAQLPAPQTTGSTLSPPKTSPRSAQVQFQGHELSPRWYQRVTRSSVTRAQPSALGRANPPPPLASPLRPPKLSAAHPPSLHAPTPTPTPTSTPVPATPLTPALGRDHRGRPRSNSTPPPLSTRCGTRERPHLLAHAHTRLHLHPPAATPIPALTLACVRMRPLAH